MGNPYAVSNLIDFLDGYESEIVEKPEDYSLEHLNPELHDYEKEGFPGKLSIDLENERFILEGENWCRELILWGDDYRLFAANYPSENEIGGFYFLEINGNVFGYENEEYTETEIKVPSRLEELDYDVEVEKARVQLVEGNASELNDAETEETGENDQGGPDEEPIAVPPPDEDELLED